MVAFADVPVRKELLDTINGIETILDSQKEIIARQLTQRGVILSPVELADLELDLSDVILKAVMQAAGLGKTSGGSLN